ncbi:hypothetical protein [Variovorax sp. RO1]|uniref:hypothetical protein n=1 Tax=Variovorax sp. RO1 TaxID=2066034 RepID=UPI0011804B45|nr:hypothetical protein [Variovorax sp. RO1]
MTFKRKTPAPEVQATPVQPAPKAWKYEDGVTADTPQEIREQWLAEYKRRQKEVLPETGTKADLFKQVR